MNRCSFFAIILVLSLLGNMGVERLKRCCICGDQTTRRTSKAQLSLWRKSSSYEGDFGCCFGPSAEGRTGDICSSCRNFLQKFRKNRDLSFHDIVDSNNNDVSKLNNANSSISSDHHYVTTYAFDAPLSGPAPSPTQTACKTDKVTSRRPPLTNLNGPTPRVIQESSSASCATTDGSTKTNNKSHVPLSPRKRSREGSPADTARVSRHRNSADEDDNRERSTSSKVRAKSKNFPIPDNGTLISQIRQRMGCWQKEIRLARSARSTGSRLFLNTHDIDHGKNQTSRDARWKAGDESKYIYYCKGEMHL